MESPAVSAVSMYTGVVSHVRWAPSRHAFAYRVSLALLDLQRLDEAFRGLWPLAAVNRRAVLAFHEADHLKNIRRADESLDAAVRRLVEERCGYMPRGRVCILTNCAYFGYCFNPVSFYYIYSASQPQRLEAIIAEVTNTPWGEQHCYVVHDAQAVARAAGAASGVSVQPEPAMAVTSSTNATAAAAVQGQVDGGVERALSAQPRVATALWKNEELREVRGAREAREAQAAGIDRVCDCGGDGDGGRDRDGDGGDSGSDGGRVSGIGNSGSNSGKGSVGGTGIDGSSRGNSHSSSSSNRCAPLPTLASPSTLTCAPVVMETEADAQRFATLSAVAPANFAALATACTALAQADSMPPCTVTPGTSTVQQAVTLTFPKTFHVSPFMSLNHMYWWRFSPPDRLLLVQNENTEEGKRMFNSQLRLVRDDSALTWWGMAYMLFIAFPLLTWRIQLWIHVEAWRLWMKGAPVFAHPHGTTTPLLRFIAALLAPLLWCWNAVDALRSPRALLKKE